MTDELKPCPFCGGGGNINEYTAGYVAVRCIHCGSEGSQVSVKKANNDRERRAKINEAIKLWNTRAERTCRNLHEPPLDFECSECHFAVTTDPGGLPNWQTEFWKQCPNCGTKVVCE